MVSGVVNRALSDAYLDTLVARNERETRLRQAAEANNEAKTRFLASTSHELRTPLNAIIGYAEMVLETSVEGRPLDTEAKEDMQRVDVEGRHLLGLISEVLELAKREASAPR